MKHLTILISFVSLLAACKKDNAPDPETGDKVELKKGLLVYLPFSGNFADSSGNNNPSQALGGAVLTTDHKGRANSALGSNGHQERVVVSNNGSIKFDSAFTISMNVMVRTRLHNQIFASMVRRIDGKGPSFGLGIGTPGDERLEFTVLKNTLNCEEPSLPSNGKNTKSNELLQVDQWYNILASFRKGQLSIYINGKLIITETGATLTAPICPQAEFLAGGWWDGAFGNAIDGSMDEVRLYDRALNEKEIAELAKDFTEPTTPPSHVDLKKGLLVYLPFNGNMADSSGNGNPTQALGGAALTWDEHGYDNSALGGSGYAERLVVSNNGSIKFDSTFSVSMNVMIRTRAQNQVFATMVRRIDGRGPSFGVGLGEPGDEHFGFTVLNNTISCDEPSLPTNGKRLQSNQLLELERWYNLVCIFDRGRESIYLNGTLVVSQTGATLTAPMCPQAEFLVGGWWDGAYANGINGVIDEVRLYNRTLNPEELTELSKEFQND